jgi:uncharacterized repeat protein (TIGR01451 family)
MTDYINGVRVNACSRNFTGLAFFPPYNYTTWSCSHSGEQSSYTNWVNAKGYGPGYTQMVQWNASAEVIIGTPTPPPTTLPPTTPPPTPPPTPTGPAVRVTKEPANQTVSSGGTATFTITVTNTGDTGLSWVNVTDYGPSAALPECSRLMMTGLAAGGSTSFTCSHSGETASYLNIVNVKAGTLDGTLVGWNATARVTVIPVAPSIRVTKLPANQTVDPGGTATFTITVTNSGNTNLAPVNVTDYGPTDVIPACSKNLTSLAAGESTSWSCSHSGETASYWNIVHVDAWAPDGTLVGWNATAKVTVIPPTEPPTPPPTETPTPGAKMEASSPSFSQIFTPFGRWMIFVRGVL